MINVYKYKINALFSSAFFKNITIVMTGTAAAQFIGFLITPILSRIYSPSEFGVFGSYSSAIHIISAGITLEYTQAVMLPKSKNDALNLLVLSFIVSIAFTILFAVMGIFFPEVIKTFIKNDNIWMIVLFILGVFSSGINKSFQSWCVRVKSFKHTAASQVMRSFTTNGAQLGLGYLRGGPLALVGAAVFGEILASVNLSRTLFPFLIKNRRSIKWDKIKQLSKEYRDFPMYSASQNVINALSTGLPVFVLTHYYGIAVAGMYAFGLRIIKVPMNFVLNALRQVLFQKASETYNNGGLLTPLYFKITLGLLSATLLPSIFFFIWAPEIFSLVFGKEWYQAGEFTRGILIWMVFAFSNLPAVLFSRLIRIQKNIFIYDLILLIARLSSLVIGGICLNALGTVIMYSIIGAVMNLILILSVGRILMRKECMTMQSILFSDK